MKFSIITVCRNAESTIQDAINSVRAQKCGDIEYIVIDGVSTDQTIEIIEKNRDIIHKYISEPDNGIYDAMNKGLGHATGDIIGFLNADDIYADNYVLQKIHTVMQNKVESCYTDLVYVKRENLNQAVRYWQSSVYNPEHVKNGWCPPHLTFFARRSVYEKYGGFDTSFALAADFELLLRFLTVHAISTEYVPFVSIKMRMGGMTNNSVKNVIKQNFEILRAYSKHNVEINSWRFLRVKIYSRLRQFLQRKNSS